MTEKNGNNKMFWYEDEVRRVESAIESRGIDKPLLFYGSGTFTLWKKLEEDLKMPNAINAGFGGSTIASLCWFFDRIVEKADPSNLVVYAGENDLGDHRHPEEVCLFTVYLIEKTRDKIGDIPFTFVGVKPSPGRVNILDRIKFTNELIEKTLKDYPNTNFLDTYYPMLQPDGYPDWEYFADDGLHLNENGYKLLTRLFLDKKDELF